MREEIDEEIAPPGQLLVAVGVRCGISVPERFEMSAVVRRVSFQVSVRNVWRIPDNGIHLSWDDVDTSGTGLCSDCGIRINPERGGADIEEIRLVDIRRLLRQCKSSRRHQKPGPSLFDAVCVNRLRLRPWNGECTSAHPGIEESIPVAGR
jgi:hypothetical protein